VGIHHELMTAAARQIIASKLWSVLQAHGDALELLELAEEVLDEVTPRVDSGSPSKVIPSISGGTSTLS